MTTSKPKKIKPAATLEDDIAKTLAMDVPKDVIAWKTPGLFGTIAPGPIKSRIPDRGTKSDQ